MITEAHPRVLAGHPQYTAAQFTGKGADGPNQTIGVLHAVSEMTTSLNHMVAEHTTTTATTTTHR